MLDAYLNINQSDLIPATFDIEHIFPKKWQDTNYNGWDKKDADLYLDRFGNKIIFVTNDNKLLEYSGELFNSNYEIINFVSDEPDINSLDCKEVVSHKLDRLYIKIVKTLHHFAYSKNLYQSQKY